MHTAGWVSFSPPIRVPAWLRTRSGQMIFLLVLHILGYALWVVFRWEQEEQRSLIGYLLYLPASFVPVAFAWWAASHRALDRQTRRAWRLLGLATLGLWGGDFLSFVQEEILIGTLPFPSLADASYLAFYPLALWGLLSFPTTRRSPVELARFWLDLGMVFVGASMVIWALVVAPTVQSEQNHPLAAAVSLAYPVGDLVALLGAFIITLRQSRPGTRWALRFLQTGLLFFVAGDLVYANLAPRRLYQTGDWPDLLWLLAFPLWAAAARLQRVHAAEEDRVSAATMPQALNLWPYVAAAIGCGLLVIYDRHLWWEPSGGLFVGTMALVSLLIARQIVTLRENTRLLAAERAARRSLERFQRLVQTSSDLIMVVDERSIIRYQTPSIERVLGYFPSELEGRRLTELLHPDDGSGALTYLARAQEQPGIAPPVEWRARHASGEWRELEAVANNLLQDPSVSGIVLTMHDITERKRVERALRESERRFQLAARAAEEVIGEWDIQSDTIWWNDSITTLFGYTADEASHGLAWWLDHVHPDDRVEVEASLRECIATRQTVWSGEYRFRRADGTYAHALHRGHLVYDEAGTPLRVIGTMQDITQRKEAERQREHLAQFEKQRALGQMASGVAHDLNQSLALVAGYAELARRALDEEQPDLERLREMLAVVNRAAMDGGESVKRLLLFSRPLQQERETKIVVLARLLQEVAQLTAPRWRDAAQAEGRSIHLRVEADADAAITGQPSELREALTNLVFNAVDALPHGGSIVLRARRQGERVEVEVADNGMGMAPEVQARIFEPFFSTKGERGSGLGLPMVLGVVEHHRGQIAIESAVGRGTTIRLSFPAACTRTHVKASATPAERPTPRRILAVDDEPALARLLASVLASDGHQVEIAHSGEEALDLLAKKQFDVVVSDVGMGAGMNGWELVRRARERWPHLRFVLATGWGAQIDPREAQARGVAAVLAKPYRLAELRQAVA